MIRAIIRLLKIILPRLLNNWEQFLADNLVVGGKLCVSESYCTLFKVNK